jgi:DNA-binding GntR family transcriptional regulator
VYEATASAGTHDERKIADLGHAFHREINRAADSTRLAALLGSVVKNLPPRFYATIQGGVEAALEEHVALLDAMTARDARKTRRLMTEHIAHGADRLIANLERRGVWEEKPVA